MSTITPHGRAECRVTIAASAGTVLVTMSLRGSVESTAILSARNTDLEMLADALREAVRAMRLAQARTIPRAE